MSSDRFALENSKKHKRIRNKISKKVNNLRIPKIIKEILIIFGSLELCMGAGEPVGR